MRQIGGSAQSEERSRNVATWGWLLHATGVLPLLVGTVVYYFVFHQPLSTEEQRLDQRVTSISQLLKDADTIQRDLQETTALLEQQRARAADVRQRIPDQPDESEYLRLLSMAAVKGGISIQDFTRGTATSNDAFSQLDINLQCEGSYESICRFLDQLEDVPRVARVISLDLDATGQQDLYPLQMIVRLYFGVHSGVRSRDATTGSPEAQPAADRDGVTWSPTRFTPKASGGEKNG